MIKINDPVHSRIASRLMKRMADGGPIGPFNPDDPKTWLRKPVSQQDVVKVPPFSSTIGDDIPAGTMPGGTPVIQPSTPGQSGFSRMVDAAAPAIKAASPFASNIINSFRKPPIPFTPAYNSPVSLSTINLDNERGRVSREINAGSADADRTVDGQTAAAIKRFDQGTKLDRFSQISEQESNANAGIRNQQAQINAGIQGSNNQKLDEYHNELTDRGIAQQREQSMNVANAGEKLTNIQNENEKRKVDLDKTRVLSTIFDNSGVLIRKRQQFQKMGLPDPLDQDYKDLVNNPKLVGTNKFGGQLKMKKFERMRPLHPLKPIPQQRQA